MCVLGIWVTTNNFLHIWTCSNPKYLPWTTERLRRRWAKKNKKWTFQFAHNWNVFNFRRNIHEGQKWASNNFDWEFRLVQFGIQTTWMEMSKITQFEYKCQSVSNSGASICQKNSNFELRFAIHYADYRQKYHEYLWFEMRNPQALFNGIPLYSGTDRQALLSYENHKHK